MNISIIFGQESQQILPNCFLIVISELDLYQYGVQIPRHRKFYFRFNSQQAYRGLTLVQLLCREKSNAIISHINKADD